MRVTESGSRRRPADLDVTLEAVEGGSWSRGPCGRRGRASAGAASAGRGAVDVAVEEVFVREPEDGEAYPIDGDHIDLEPLARETIVLSLPLAPLCRPTAAGCARHAAPISMRGDCDCPHRSPPTPVAALMHYARTPKLDAFVFLESLDS